MEASGNTTTILGSSSVVPSPPVPNHHRRTTHAATEWPARWCIPSQGGAMPVVAKDAHQDLVLHTKAVHH
jgi:hypothetical protein